MSSRERLSLVIAHLYPDLMNLYGDRGNVICLVKRCQWRGIDPVVVEVGLGDKMEASAFDLIFIGGGQDKEQRLAADDLQRSKGDAILRAVEGGVVVLAICGGYQLFGRYYRPAMGPDLPGIGLFPLETVHKGAQVPRCIGNVTVEWEGRLLVGFENHGGRTYLAPGASPLGRVIHGFGNNGEDKTEGAIVKNAFGTYLHGSLLPKNPHFADHLIRLALRRRYGNVDLEPLGDATEWRAHQAALERVRA